MTAYFLTILRHWTELRYAPSYISQRLVISVFSSQKSAIYASGFIILIASVCQHINSKLLYLTSSQIYIFVKLYWNLPYIFHKLIRLYYFVQLCVHSAQRLKISIFASFHRARRFFLLTLNSRNTSSRSYIAKNTNKIPLTGVDV